jgi:hypothetical protein
MFRLPVDHQNEFCEGWKDVKDLRTTLWSTVVLDVFHCAGVNMKCVNL